MRLIDYAVAAYCIVGAGLMAQGLRYLVAGQFMHYHADVIKERWNQLPVAEQRLMLGLLKGFGAGMFCLGIAIIFIAIEPLPRGAMMVHWFLAVISVTYTAMLYRVTKAALLPGAAPITVTTVMCTLCVAASMVSVYVGITR